MKKRIPALAVMACMAVACQNDDSNDTFINPINHVIAVTYNEDFGSLAASNASVTLTNLEDGKVYTVTTDNTGVSSTAILPGTYNVAATLSLTPEAYFAFTGQEVEDNIVFNASVQNKTITATATDTTKLSLVTGRVGSLLLKQVYFAGSHNKLGANYRDQFVEIYNNSNETLYLDGLCFAQLKGEGSTSSVIASYSLPNGQYDWRQSIGQTKGENSNTGYVYAEEVLRIPGSGTQYPLAPGKGAILAATAVNHKAPLVGKDVKGNTVTYEVPEPDRTIDLSKAPFEAYYQEYFKALGQNYAASDIDNPASVNVQIVFKSFAGDDLILDTNGRDAFAIFYADDVTIASWAALPLPSITADKLEGTKARYVQVPNDVVIDAVEIQNDDPSKPKPKRVADVLDAGETFAPAGKLSSQSVIRKVSKTIGDRVIFQDTNNSTNDFIPSDRPQVVIE